MKLSTLIGCSLCLAAGFFTLGRLPMNAQAPQAATEQRRPRR